MHDDDDILSPILGRRQLLRSATIAGLLGLGLHRIADKQARAAAYADDLDASDLVDQSMLGSGCVLTPAQVVGPYYLNLNLLRSNITEGQIGIPMQLVLNVVRASDCSPVAGAAVDVWHANNPGRYSGFANQSTQGLTWLRGVQLTDAQGMVVFDTIYPGWYPGRTQHIHVKVRPTTGTELTTQVYFPDRLNRRVNAIAPYSAHGQNPTSNLNDGIYNPACVLNLAGTGPLRMQFSIGVA